MFKIVPDRQKITSQKLSQTFLNFSKGQKKFLYGHTDWEGNRKRCENEIEREGEAKLKHERVRESMREQKQ